jgi:hypothetical protein
VDTASRKPARGSTRVNHACWVHGRAPTWRDSASAFLTEGVVGGDRLEYLGSGTLEEIRSRLDGTPHLTMLIDGGHLTLRSIDEIYGASHVVDPSRTVTAYDAATRAALADGYTGLRVVAEATDLVRTVAQREAFARYEHLIDRYMVDHPFSAMCVYDASELGEDAAAEIACLHPAVSKGATAFRWFAAGGNEVGLAGEVDIESLDVFARTLARTMPLQSGPTLVVDAGALAFIDHHGLLALEEHALLAGTTVTVRTDSSLVHRLADLLSLQAVRPEWSR